MDAMSNGLGQYLTLLRINLTSESTDKNAPSTITAGQMVPCKNTSPRLAYGVRMLRSASSLIKSNCASIALARAMPLVLPS